MNFWRNRSVLLTGGCGFLGSYAAEELVAEGAQVTIVDNLQSGRLENIKSVRDRVEFVRADLRYRDVCEKVSAGFEVVLNFAGTAYGLEYSMKHHGEMLYSNLAIQSHMLEAARVNKVRSFLMVSSSCVYPDEAPIPTPEIDVLTGLPEPVNEGYGWAKRMAELQARYYHAEYGMGIGVCRPFNPYGDHYHWDGDKSHVLPSLVKRVLDGENPIVVWGTGRQRRNFLHARDTVRLMMMVTERYPCAKPVNIGYDDDISIAELVSLICEVSGKRPEVAFDTSRPEGRFRKCADATLLRKVTDNYQPQVPLREGIAEMVRWYHNSFSRSPQCSRT
ncbi:MAG: NAD-dependent epimerase/dehydratase family protein [Terriglobia bacterium]